MTETQPLLAIFYNGGRRPWALRCAMRDVGLGLVDIRDIVLIDEGAIWTMRSKVATAFLEKKTHLAWALMVDGDMRWREDMIPILGAVCEEHRGVAGAVVSKDGFGQGLATALPPGRYSDLHEGGSRSVETLEAIGSPTAIHRDALRKILEQLGPESGALARAVATNRGLDAIREAAGLEVRECTDGLSRWWSFFNPRGMWSERKGAWIDRADDSSFCDRARAAGVSMRVALGPQVEHWGEHGFLPIDGLRGAQ